MFMANFFHNYIIWAWLEIPQQKKNSVKEYTGVKTKIQAIRAGVTDENSELFSSFLQTVEYENHSKLEIDSAEMEKHHV